MARKPKNLDELLEILNAGETWRGAPTQNGELDITSLPTFGGREPSDTEGVWSWDATRRIVSGINGGFEIEDRAAQGGK